MFPTCIIAIIIVFLFDARKKTHSLFLSFFLSFFLFFFTPKVFRHFPQLRRFLAQEPGERSHSENHPPSCGRRGNSSAVIGAWKGVVPRNLVETTEID